jgi:hypothetical protein
MDSLRSLPYAHELESKDTPPSLLPYSFPCSYAHMLISATVPQQASDQIEYCIRLYYACHTLLRLPYLARRLNKEGRCWWVATIIFNKQGGYIILLESQKPKTKNQKRRSGPRAKGHGTKNEERRTKNESVDPKKRNGSEGARREKNAQKQL